MRRRPWVIVLAVVLFAVTFSVIVFTRYLNRSNLIRDRILKTLEVVPGSVQIESALLRPTTLRLSNFFYITPDSSFSVSVPEIRLNLRIGNLVTRKGSIARLISGAALINPLISMYKLPSSGVEKQETDVRIDLAGYEFFNQLFVQDGEFRFESVGDIPWIRVHSLEGWVDATNLEELIFGLSCGLYEDSSSVINIQGSADLVELLANAQMSIQDYDLENIMLPGPAPVDSFTGQLGMEFDISYDGKDWESSGTWVMRDAGVHVKGGPRITEIVMSGSLGESLLSAEGTCLFENDETQLSFVFSFLDSPTFDAKAEVPKGDLGRHLMKFAELDREFAPRGILDAAAHFHWSPTSGRWRAWATAASGCMETEIGPIRNIESTMSWSRKRQYLTFDSFTADYYGMDVRGSGKWTPLKDLCFDVDLEVDGKCDPTALPDYAQPLNSKTAEAHVDITLRKGQRWLVDAEGKVHSEGDPALGELSGSYSLKGYNASLNLYSPYRDDAAIELSREMNDPIHISTVEPVIMAQWWDDELNFSDFVSRLKISAGVDIEENRYATSARVLDTKTNLEVEAYGTLTENPDSSYNGVYSYSLVREDDLIGNGDVDFTYSENAAAINGFTFNDYLSIKGRLDLDRREFFDLSLIVEDLDIGDVVERATTLTAEDVSGLINGRADISGSMSLPVINAHFELSEGRYGNLEQYWGNFSLGTSEAGIVEILDGSFGRAETILLEMGGKYDIPGDSLSINLESRGSDASVFAKALTGNEEILEGKIFSLDGRINGSLGLPSWSASARLSDSRLLGIQFDSIRVLLEGEATSRLGHVVYFRDFILDRAGDYRFSMRGAVPLNRSAGLITTRIEGDVLQVLPQLSDFFVEASGEGSVEATWVIVAGENLALGQSSVKIDSGRIVFAEVMPGVSDFEVDIEVDDFGRMAVNRFNGSIGQSGPFEIINERGDYEDSTLLKCPILVKAIDLDLGVLKLTTPGDKGIPLNIPGVMTTPEYSGVSFHGKHSLSSSPVTSESVADQSFSDIETADEWFTISGPEPGCKLLPDINRLVAGEDRSLSVVTDPGIQVSPDSLAALMSREMLTDDMPGLAAEESMNGDIPNDLMSLQIGKSYGDGLSISGSVHVSDTRFTYPPLQENNENDPGDAGIGFIERLLLSARWDMDLIIDRDVWYTREIEGFENAPIVKQFKGFFDRISLEAMVDPTEPDQPVEVTGSLVDNSFRLNGDIVSSEGKLEFLEQIFEVDKAEISFDQSDILPVVSGRAGLTITDPETGFPWNIYLTLYVLDPVTGQRTTRGRWGDFILVLEGDPGTSIEEERSQEQILALMGYSAEGLGDNLGSIGGSLLTRTLARRFLRPIERDIARLLNVDLIRIDPVLTPGMFGQQTTPDQYDFEFRLRMGMAGRYEPGSTITVGKYITPDFYVSYTGQLASEAADYASTSEQGRVGLLQTWNVTYRISELAPNLVLDAGWEYDNLENQDNRSAKLRYTFNF